MGKHTIQELQQWQQLPLSVKVLMTKERIREWIHEYGEDGVYVSFSGGKDSTVLLDIVRQDYPNVEAVFVDVPTQYPELKQFATSFQNVTVLHPQIGYKQVVEKYGFPFISKEVSECVSGARKYLTQILNEENILTDRQTDTTNIFITDSQDKGNTVNFPNPLLSMSALSQKIVGVGTITNIADSEELANILNYRMKNRIGGNNQRLAQMLEMLTKTGRIIPRKDIPSKDRSSFAYSKYQFFLDAPFEISNKCCNIMKKNPAHSFYRKTGKKPIVGTMASESKLRTQKWMQNGCNGFDLKIPTSTPMSFWTEQDVLLYIKQHNLPICSVYGDVVEDFEGMGQLEGQMSLKDFADEKELFDLDNPLLTTTGCKRTGCVLCGFGCHIKGDTRFVDLKKSHPGLYGLIDVIENNGVTMREAIEWLNEHGDMNIKI